jgi:tetratricopeptide (TPR) repeat protein
VGAARSGDIQRARETVAFLKSGSEQAEASRDRRTGMQWSYLTAAAWLAQAEKKPEAIDLMKAAVEREATSGGAGRLPASAMMGDLLMELGRPKEALASYEDSLRIAPRRFNALYGAAHAAELAGDGEKARALYTQFADLCRNATSDRPELQKAKVYLAAR